MAPHVVGGEGEKGKGEGVRHLVARRKDPNLLFLAPTEVPLPAMCALNPSYLVCAVFKESSHRRDSSCAWWRRCQGGKGETLCFATASRLTTITDPDGKSGGGGVGGYSGVLISLK